MSSEDSAGLNIQDDTLVCPAAGAECGHGAPLSVQPEHLYMASSCGVGFLQHGGLVLRRVFCTNEYFMKHRWQLQVGPKVMPEVAECHIYNTLLPDGVVAQPGVKGKDG